MHLVYLLYTYNKFGDFFLTKLWFQTEGWLKNIEAMGTETDQYVPANELDKTAFYPGAVINQMT